ncbi:uracil-DNA glycosylase family protein [Paenibacillus piri]|uniref:DUF4918 family protein n=1 Tax=Paenibacillus piri TaxID=2547395 RepID=A0A4R5KQI5_9BACL|nr:uracil-DNA glycosylase family protein [Paenibacillus piri]TDF98001.1 DUF4918 family protein [Paenibacillus piri]
MQAILDYHHSFYQNIFTAQSGIDQDLGKKDVRILDGFIRQQEIVKQFYQRYYCENSKPRLVLCGINPGRRGAGKTGVPFLDFKSLSQLMPEINNNDEELSAQFVFKVIAHFGADTFFQHVYLTNISWFGFEGTNNGRKVNVNYYELDDHEQMIFTRGFIEEMKVVKPACIIPLSEKVEKTLQRMNLPYPLGPKLYHPYYCSIKTNTEKGFQEYVRVISDHIQNSNYGTG